MTTQIQHFFDPATYTLSYIVFDDKTKDAIVVDPVLDFDQASSTLSTSSIELLCKYIKSHNLKLHYIMETHAHADHITGAIALQKRYPKSKILIGENITKVQKSFKHIYNFKDFNTNGVQFDRLLKDEETIEAGSLLIKTIFTPGHTPACCSYLVNERHLFTGDALFMPDYGTGRCDFPLGSAKDLYHSVHEKIYQLDDSVAYYTGHDYQPKGRDLRYKATIGESKKENIQLNQSTGENDFISFREKRDATLKTPKLLYPSIQINIDGGNLPLKEDNETSYIKTPISYKKESND